MKTIQIWQLSQSKVSSIIEEALSSLLMKDNRRSCKEKETLERIWQYLFAAVLRNNCPDLHIKAFTLL